MMDTPVSATDELARVERRLMTVRKWIKDLRERERDDETWLAFHTVELHTLVDQLQAKVIEIRGGEIFRAFREQEKRL
jgi:hypothetical protein